MSEEKDNNTPATQADTNNETSPASPSDQDQSTETPAPAVAKEPKQGGSRASLIAVLALLLALTAAGGTWWLWQQLQSSAQTLGHTLKEQRRSNLGDMAQLDERISALSSELLAKLNAQKQQITALKTKVNAAISSTEQVAETLTALHSKLNFNPKTGWLIAEAEYLLSIANQQLQLVGDIDSSIAALRNADQRLRESGDPTVLDIRSIIADEISQLQSLPVTDITGAALTLASLQTRVDELSLAGHQEDMIELANNEAEARHEEPPQAGWRAGLEKAWQAVKELVVIRQRGDKGGSNPLLSPDQRALIYQNLRLKLESARLSLVQGDAATFRQSLDIAHDWLLEYFDDDAKRNALKDTLDKLGQIELNPELPDISASLDALRAWQQQRNNQAH